MIKIALLGSTGSIGSQVAEVVRRYPERFRIVALAANRNARAFLSQVREFRPAVAALADETAAAEIAGEIPEGTELARGPGALLEAARADCDVLFAAVMGFAGLGAVLEGIRLGRKIALANKETLVAGGALVTEEAAKRRVPVLPVDSEHSAVWQSLGCDFTTPYSRIILTASGGPFRGYTSEMLGRVTREDALRHPNWSMGRKITVDSATLMNKGLEVIEAMWLFGAPLEKIDVVVHPESIVHSMVEFPDGAVIAEMSMPSMEIPIQLALTYPERLPVRAGRVDFARLGRLTFEPVDGGVFRCFSLALEAAKAGGDRPACLNAANERAVELFLAGKIAFADIPRRVENALSRVERLPATSYENLLETDRRARLAAEADR